jgi:hypothetical protein
MAFTASPHKEEAKQLFRDGASLEEVLKRFPISVKTAGRYQKAVELEKQQPPPPPPPPPPAVSVTPKGGKETGTKVGGELGTVLQPKAGSIVFTLGQKVIELNPSYLFDAYQYWEDMKREHQIEEDFSQTIKTAVKHAWEVLNHAKVEKQPVGVAR